MDTKRMRACAPLLPPPGDEVVVQCLDEIERLRADAELLAWVVEHPETCAECLQDAAAGDGTARENLELRRAGLTPNVADERQR